MFPEHELDGTKRFGARLRGLVLIGSTAWFGLFCLHACSWAAGRVDPALGAAALLDLEHQAELARPRDQCFLYAQVVDGLADLAGRQITAGQDQQAAQTMEHVEQVASKLEAATSNNAHRLKGAEEMLSHTTRRVGDMVRVVSDQQRERMQHTLQRLDAVHSRLIHAVFAQ